jgi:hypothetical protein
MKYETPEVTVLTTAINAVQSASTPKNSPVSQDGIFQEHTAAYQDWE